MLKLYYSHYVLQGGTCRTDSVVCVPRNSKAVKFSSDLKLRLLILSCRYIQLTIQAVTFSMGLSLKVKLSGLDLEAQGLFLSLELT